MHQLTSTPSDWTRTFSPVPTTCSSRCAEQSAPHGSERCWNDGFVLLAIFHPALFGLGQLHVESGGR